MRRCLAAACLLALVAAAPAEGKKRHRTCQRKGSTTLASDKYVRVYERDVKGDADTFPGSKLAACVRKTNKRTVLATAFDNGIDQSNTYGQVHLRRAWVAWYTVAEDDSCKAECAGFDATTEEIHVLNLRHHTRRHAFSTVDGKSLVLTSVGGVAWAELYGMTPSVRALDRDGRRTLDTGNIDIHSLRAGKFRVSWLKDGVRQYATLR